MTTDGVGSRRLGPAAVLVISATLALGLAACSGSSTVADSSAAPPGSAGAASASVAASAAPGTTAPVAKPAVPSVGCKAGAVDEVEYDKQTMNVAGMDRFFNFSRPGGQGDKPVPLVVDFHGLLEGADIQAHLTELGPKGEQEGFAVSEPNGSGTPLRWNTNPDTSANPDLQFIDAMLDKIEAENCIDKSRVYSTGLSYGAIMTSFLACNRADVFAAFAPVSGITLGANCAQDHKTPILTFHGTSDPILFFNGGVNPAILAVMGAGKGADQTTTTTAAPDINGAGYPATVAKWAAMNGCDSTPKDTDVSDKVIHRVYSCPKGQDVEFFIIKGGGHNWPGSSLGAGGARVGALGEVNQDIKANDEVWTFFQRFQLPTA